MHSTSGRGRRIIDQSLDCPDRLLHFCRRNGNSTAPAACVPGAAAKIATIACHNSYPVPGKRNDNQRRRGRGLSLFGWIEFPVRPHLFPCSTARELLHKLLVSRENRNGWRAEKRNSLLPGKIAAPPPAIALPTLRRQTRDQQREQVKQPADQTADHGSVHPDELQIGADRQLDAV